MNSSGGHNPTQCTGHCHDCSLYDAATGTRGPWAGWRFAAAAAATFLLPLAAAITAGVLFRGQTHLQLAGVAGGLVLGAALARLLLRLIPVTPSTTSCPLP